jgi:hypothetical protein
MYEGLLRRPTRRFHYVHRFTSAIHVVLITMLGLSILRFLYIYEGLLRFVFRNVETILTSGIQGPEQGGPSPRCCSRQLAHQQQHDFLQ